MRSLKLLTRLIWKVSCSYDSWSDLYAEQPELHIRSTRLLLTVEKSQEEQQSHQNNAIIFGAYPSQQAI